MEIIANLLLKDGCREWAAEAVNGIDPPAAATAASAAAATAANATAATAAVLFLLLPMMLMPRCTVAEASVWNEKHSWNELTLSRKTLSKPFYENYFYSYIVGLPISDANDLGFLADNNASDHKRIGPQSHLFSNF